MRDGATAAGGSHPHACARVATLRHRTLRRRPYSHEPLEWAMQLCSHMPYRQRCRLLSVISVTLSTGDALGGCRGVAKTMSSGITDTEISAL